MEYRKCMKLGGTNLQEFQLVHSWRCKILAQNFNFFLREVSRRRFDFSRLIPTEGGRRWRRWNIALAPASRRGRRDVGGGRTTFRKLMATKKGEEWDKYAWSSGSLSPNLKAHWPGPVGPIKPTFAFVAENSWTRFAREHGVGDRITCALASFEF